MAIRKVSAKTEAVSEESTKREITFADKVWDKLKDIDIEIFALPGQTVKDHVERADVMPDQLHLILKAPAMLPVLEEVVIKFGPKMDLLNEHQAFDLVQTQRYAIIKVVDKEY